MNDIELNRRELTGDDALRFAREAGMEHASEMRTLFLCGVGDLIRFARLVRDGWTTPGPAAWRTVERDGLPPCDGHTTFIGINSAGYACCFNVLHHGLCIMRTAEGAYRQMSDLRQWRLLDRPHIAGVNLTDGAQR